MPTDFDHAGHPYRNSDQHVLIIMIATILSSMWVPFWSVVTALGSGLASTPEHPVPHVSNVLWTMSGFSFVVCVVLYFATLITRRRRFGFALGFVVLASGLALIGGELVNWMENQSDWSTLQHANFELVVVPIIASAVIFWKSRELLPWGPLPDTP